MVKKPDYATSSAKPKELRREQQIEEQIIEKERIEARFGTRLRFLRKQRQITQVVLAERTGLHQNYISEIEQGKRNITLRVIELLAKALEVQEKAFFE